MRYMVTFAVWVVIGYGLHDMFITITNHLAK